MTRSYQLLGLERPWKSDMLQAVDDALDAHRRFRRREINIKIEEIGSEDEKKIASRESCRINSGASIVIPHVVPFLVNLDVKKLLSSLIEHRLLNKRNCLRESMVIHAEHSTGDAAPMRIGSLSVDAFQNTPSSISAYNSYQLQQWYKHAR
eukprot:scaffold7759_cov62-Cylindrotheca_fusiformis.AAC.3